MISLGKSLPGLYNVGMLVLFFVTIFTIIGVEFFRELITDDDSNPRPGVVSFENGGMSVKLLPIAPSDCSLQPLSWPSRAPVLLA